MGTISNTNEPVMTTKLDNIEVKLAEVLSGVNEALQRLVSLEERSQFHQQGLSTLKDELRENGKRLTDLEKSSVKVDLLEKDLSHSLAKINDVQKDVEVLKGIVTELEKVALSHTAFLSQQKAVIGTVILAFASSIGSFAWTFFKG